MIVQDFYGPYKEVTTGSTYRAIPGDARYLRISPTTNIDLILPFSDVNFLKTGGPHFFIVNTSVSYQISVKRYILNDLVCIVPAAPGGGDKYGVMLWLIENSSWGLWSYSIYRNIP